METSHEEIAATKLSAKLTKAEDISVPKFDFEDMIIEHRRRFPQTAGLVESPKFTKPILQPFLFFWALPIAFFKVKLNTILALEWKKYLKLWVIILLLAIPISIFSIVGTTGTDSLGMVYRDGSPVPDLAATDDYIIVEGKFYQIVNGVLEERQPPQQTFNLIGNVSFFIIIPILVSIGFALFYLKNTHDSLFNLRLEKKVEWLDEPVSEFYLKFYDRKMSLNPIILTLSVIIGVGINIPLLIFSTGLALTIGIISCFTTPMLTYLFIISVIYLIQNSRVYSKVLKTIKDRIDKYLNEYGTLLNEENYEIIWALGETSARSIKQLENIPITGVLAGLFTTLGMFMGLLNVISLGFIINSGEILVLRIPLIAQKGVALPIVFALLALLLAVIMVVAFILPLFPFRKKMRLFKRKALMELDGFIIATVDEFEQKYDEGAKLEQMTIFALRSFIAEMRTIPISSVKIFRTLMAVVVYFLNIRRIFRVASGAGN